MNTYKITYTGNDSRFQNLCIEQNANNAREAVIKFFSERINDRYFPQDDGSIKDANGMTICETNQDYIKHDGGYFEADAKMTYDVQFHDETTSDFKGFAESLEFCQNYIQFNNGTDESYFANYKGGIVQIICNETGEIIESHIVG
jgi:hypothetical protein